MLSVLRVNSISERIINEYGAGGEMRNGIGNSGTQKKTCPVPFCPPQIPHNLIWE
jgi:hypothetical protein